MTLFCLAQRRLGVEVAARQDPGYHRQLDAASWLAEQVAKGGERVHDASYFLKEKKGNGV